MWQLGCGRHALSGGRTVTEGNRESVPQEISVQRQVAVDELFKEMEANPWKKENSASKREWTTVSGIRISLDLATSLWMTMP